MIVLGIDPGGTTGYGAVLLGTDTNTQEEVIKFIEAGELPDWHGLEELIIKINPQVIIYEQFKLYPWRAKDQSWSEMETVQVIGVLHYLCEKYNKIVKGQGANEKKLVRPKAIAMLKAYGNKSRYSDHSIDALTHALVYLRKEKKHEGISGG